MTDRLNAPRSRPEPATLQSDPVCAAGRARGGSRWAVELGARVDADPYRGTPLTWAAVNGHANAIRTLVELGADPNHRGTFGGPSHGGGVTAIHLAAQAGKHDAVLALLELGADPLILDALHGGNALGWARAGGHEELAEILP